MAASFAFYSGLLLVHFMPFSSSGKILLSSLLVICGEGSFWIGVLILGKQVVSKYRSFNPKAGLTEFEVQNHLKITVKIILIKTGRAAAIILGKHSAFHMHAISIDIGNYRIAAHKLHIILKRYIR